MHVLLTGATGFVGQKLVSELVEHGHKISILTRNAPKAAIKMGNQYIYWNWNPTTELIEEAAFKGVDAIINLMGENLATRWTEAKKKSIYDSRIVGTQNLIASLNKYRTTSATGVKTLVSTSAIGIYGDHPGSEELTEEFPVEPRDFLSGLCIDWEKAATENLSEGIRLCKLRVGIVLDKGGGALAKMLTPFKLGVGGIIGDGSQVMSWIQRDDLVNLYVHCLEHESVEGVVNATAPRPVSNKVFTHTLGKILKRPTVFPMPAFAAKLAFGEMSVILLEGQYVIPKKALNSSFVFQCDTIEKALRKSIE
ncbi:MAG: TIGR01777 family protein [Halobacteriovoraceae bacterium]|nr:TIGR01777 family protein [Halobacteriovoraceae bacterium]MCB9093809.1 TIGR01777 family protein [Halobacteriovoraceae bacterium]